MIDISRRPLNDQERSSLERETKPIRLGCVSAFAYYGAFLILLPLMGGGLIGNVLLYFGASKNLAFTSGITLCLLVGIWLVLTQNHRVGKNISRMREDAESILAGGVLEVVLITDVTRAWRVVTEEDDQVGLVLLTRQSECVLLLGENLDWIIEEGQTFPSSVVSVERYPGTQGIVGVHPAGAAVPTEDAKLPMTALPPRIDTHLDSCCVVLPTGFDPAALSMGRSAER